MNNNNKSAPQSSASKPMGGPGRGGPGGPGGGPGGGGPGGGVRGLLPGEKAKDFKGTVARLLRYLSKDYFAIVIVFLFAVGSTVFAIIGPRTMGRATTELAKGLMAMYAGTGGVDFSIIKGILFTTLALYGTSTVMQLLQGWLMSGVSTRLTYRMRKEISEKINRVPLKYFDSNSTGDTLSRVTNDVNTVSQSLSQNIVQVISSFVTVIGVTYMMFSISWQMTFIALTMIPASLLAVVLIVKRSQPLFKQQQQFLGDINGHVEEMYGAHNLVKAFNGEQRSLEDFETMNAKLFSSAWKSQFLSGLMQPIMNFIGNLGYIAVCILGGYYTIKGTVTIGDIQAFINYVRNFTQPMTQLANSSNVFQQTAAAAERVFQFLAEEEEPVDDKEAASIKNLKGDIEFDHIRFGYDADKIVISDFSETILSGATVALVGPTGAGKTTIVKLMMRYYDLLGGAINIDDINIHDFKRKELRSMFGMVLQDTWLYNDTIMNNIRYGSPDKTDEDVIAAAKAAHVHQFVQTLTNGYDTVLGEDSDNISQGQKQLLTIARAILYNPKILLLDEATSSVDTRTEQQIQQAMRKLMAGRTSFVIAHRLSTIRDADKIIVLRGGDIVEVGNHDALLAKKGFYADLYMSQFEPDEA